MTAGRQAFALGAVAGIVAVLFEFRFHASAPIFLGFCVGALLIIVVDVGAWGTSETDRPQQAQRPQRP